MRESDLTDLPAQNGDSGLVGAKSNKRDVLGIARRFLYEISESFRIAFAQIYANKMRSALTALGVVIGIVAVTLMGTAIRGIDEGFDRNLSMLGNDILYVQKWPWGHVEDWWNYANRPPLRVEDAEKLNRIIAGTINSPIDFAVPVATWSAAIKVSDARIEGVFIIGSTSDYGRLSSIEYLEGRLFNEAEAVSGRQVCVLGYDVADALFHGRSAIDETVQIGGQPHKVIGVLSKQGSFLGLFSQDNQAIIPLSSFKKVFSTRRGAEFRVKAKDRTQVASAKEELQGVMRRLRAQLPEERDNFSINEQQAFKDELGPVKTGIFLAGIGITGLSLFVGAIGIMNITFVSVKERTKEIGTRKALGARRKTILLQFLIEAISICFCGGLIGTILTFLAVLIVQIQMPSLPVVFSFDLILLATSLSILVGILSGFVPAWQASKLDPVVALRYE